MNNRIGIDGGGSLIKIVFEEKGKLHFRKQRIEELDEVMRWLKIISPNKIVHLTGGRARKLKSMYFPEGKVVDEFSAVCKGANYLMRKNGILTNEHSLLVNIGTGTSWFKLNGEQYARVLGSGIGGGTFMGLGKIITDSGDFADLVSFAAAGEKGLVDLLVKDIYDAEEAPISGNLTASNFAKLQGISSSSPSDKIASLINMIAETITLLTAQTATIHRIKKVFFIGSTLAGNQPLQESLMTYCEMSSLDSNFLGNGEFSGAIGAML
ncbi:type II pantothenate kinase [Mesobacillus jeotgali]|uniref:type II pantothenate kinase n=1 Tax=Mesobacillus jeotgali TaxID=129985 RepID=UPI0009A6A478|nr:type II pantothenate kinase [Mesobacillus jeotgali]